MVTWYKSRFFTKIGNDNVIKLSTTFWLTDGAVLEMGNNCRILDHAFFQLTKPHPQLIIGDNVTIGRYDMITVKSRMTIGSNTIMGAFVQIIDHNHSFALGVPIREQLAEIKDVTIGEDCWIGTGAKILCGVTLGTGCVIGANAVVTHDVPPYSIAAGVPARVIGKRQ